MNDTPKIPGTRPRQSFLIAKTQHLGIAFTMPGKLDVNVLLHKGMKLLSERGIASISIQDIVQATGAHRGSLYRHFGSREGSIRAVLEY
ncbi:MAG: helix-turn-helix transcriptional regulator [Deltaproteobacteria bacterium]|nr:helix-turn-helix transcriptional regulator [Deltaproteobacteria bacterium]